MILNVDLYIGLLPPGGGDTRRDRLMFVLTSERVIVFLNHLIIVIELLRK